MTIELKDVKQVADELGAKFEEFKQQNNKRVEAIEAEKHSLSSNVDKLNEKLTELDSYKSELEKELLEMKRPGRPGAGEDKLKAEHKAAFSQFMRKGVENGLRDLEVKALNTGVDDDGGYAVPEELDRAILELERNASPLRQLCNQITVSTSDYKKLVNLGGAGSGWVGETAARPATNTPKLAQIVAHMGEIYANPQATQTSLDDIFFNAEAWLTGEVATEFAEQENLAFLTGNGTNKPKGILAYDMTTEADAVRDFGKLQAVETGTAGSFSANNLVDLIYALKAGYRGNARFMMSQMTVALARKIVDSQGNYLWQPGLQLGQPSTLIGFGIAENEDMPGAEADANAILFGDFNRGYTIVDRIGTRILRDPYTNKPYVGFYTTKRVGGMLTDSNAIKVLKLSA